MYCVIFDIRVYDVLFLFVFFPWGIPPLQSDWSMSCDHGLDHANYCEYNNNNHNNNSNNNNNIYIWGRKEYMVECIRNTSYVTRVNSLRTLYLPPKNKEDQRFIFWIWTLFKVRRECRKFVCMINGTTWRH